MKNLRVALVHDYLREYGGAERVLEALHEMFPDAPVYTAFVDTEALGVHWHRFVDWKIVESGASRFPFIKKLYSPLRVLSSYFFERFDLSSYDVVISSTNLYMAKAVLTGPQTVHFSYIHTPPRSLYGYSTASNWKKNPFTRIIGELINFKMRQIDFLTAQRPDVLIANSKEVHHRIQKFYRRDSVVIYPPVQTPSIKEQAPPKGEYYLFVNRLVLTKHPEIAVTVAQELSLPLKVVGAGPLLAELEQHASENIEFLGSVSDEKLQELYSNAKALLYPAEEEDFGIVPVEAMMHGVPVIAHNSGGPRETVVDGKTGVLFDDLSVAGLKQAIEKFETKKFDASVITHHARLFSKERFQEKMIELIEKHMQQKGN